MNLNGPWKFSICPEKWEFPADWDGDIEVPFCLQSPLSGALKQLGEERMSDLGLHGPPLAPSLRKGYALWYSNTIELPVHWSNEVWLHVGACDSSAEVFVNGKSVGTHEGGNTAFSFNITGALTKVEGGGFHLARIDLKSTDAASLDKPCGKQVAKATVYRNTVNLATLYSNISGIWQTVWLESRPFEHLTALRIAAEFRKRKGWSLELRADLSDLAYQTSGMRLEANLFADRSCTGGAIAKASTPVAGDDSDVETSPETLQLKLKVSQENTHLWCPTNPHLYGLQLFVKTEEGHVVDKVSSYAALRIVSCDGDQFCLNGSPIFLRLVLDQGYYPEGLWTAPRSDLLRRDIVNAQKMGFNGARLHQKVFEPLYFAHADELGFLAFCEYPDWNGGLSNRWETSDAYQDYVKQEWTTLVSDLQNHPSIVAWGIFNEFGPKNGWDRHYGPGGGFRHRYSLEEAKEKVEKQQRFVRSTVRLVRKLDFQKRPIHDSSGWIHLYTDLWSFHDYEQKVDRWSKLLDEPNKYLDGRKNQPLLVAEYAGVGFDAGGPFGLNKEKFLAGYAQKGCGLPSTAEEAVLRIEGLTAEIYKRECYAGFCFTQLYDVEYEKNGLLKYDRDPKFQHDFRKIFDGRLQIGRWSEAPPASGSKEHYERSKEDPSDPQTGLPRETKREENEENEENEERKRSKEEKDPEGTEEQRPPKKPKLPAKKTSEKAKEKKEETAEMETEKPLQKPKPPDDKAPEKPKEKKKRKKRRKDKNPPKTD